MVRNLVGDHFCEDDHGRDGHGHATKSKETLYINKSKENLFINVTSLNYLRSFSVPLLH
jgi:hypothetical protein